MEDYIVRIGGLFAVLAFVHFFVDWVFQRHSEAMVKHKDRLIRAKHCAIYTLGFQPLFWAMSTEWWAWVAGSAVLFLSHFFEDTYVPVYWWCKYIRQPPGFYPGMTEVELREQFVGFIQTNLGTILMIAIDQIIHLLFLWPVAALMLVK